MYFFPFAEGGWLDTILEDQLPLSDATGDASAQRAGSNREAGPDGGPRGSERLREIHLHPVAAASLRSDHRHRDTGPPRHRFGLAGYAQIAARCRGAGAGALRSNDRGEHRLR